MDTRSASDSPAWLRFIIDHNPFFLLSAICMMFGCHVLNLALYTRAGDIHNLLILLGIVNVYEMALIGLGLVLLGRKGPEQRDAHTLMGLEALFLADTTFVSGVISTIDARWGWGLDAVLLTLSIVKVVIVARALQLPRANRIVALVALQLLVVLLTPTVFKQVAMGRQGFLPELAVYLAWWVAGLIPVVAAALFWPRSSDASPRLSGATLVLSIIYLVVPFLSVLMHVYGAGWVYDFYLAPAELSPLLLGFAVGLSAVRNRQRTQPILGWQLVLTAAAVLLSLDHRSTMSFSVGGLGFTPVRLTLLGAGLVGLHLLWQYGRLYAVVAGAAGAGMTVLWPHLPRIWTTLGRAAQEGWSFLGRLIPKTAIQWGVACVVASFVLLGVGAAYSFRRKPEPPETPQPPDEPAPEPQEAPQPLVESAPEPQEQPRAEEPVA